MELKDAISYLEKVILVNKGIIEQAIKSNEKQVVEDVNTQKVALETVLEELENSIPKKKIEHKIKELNEKGNYRTKNNPNGRVHFYVEPCDYQIQVLQELLEDK